MYLTGLSHRDQLFTIALRWFGDQPAETDGRTVTEIFAFEPLISGPAIRTFVVDVLSEHYREPLTFQPVRSKEVLRECVVQSITEMTPRLSKLVREFRTYPEEFFPRTPVDAVIFQTRGGRLVGMSRIKRPRRIAEKAARRVSDRLIGLIRDVGDRLAERRAERLGVAVEQLTSTPDEMAHDFLTAERVIARQFQADTINLGPEQVRIDDVAGVKFAGAPRELDAIEKIIYEHPRARVVEREEHRGRYNAVNIQLDLTLPPPDEYLKRAGHIDWSFGAKRGISAEDLKRAFAPYMEAGARTVRVEVILTTYPELVESELGRALHERRVLRLRDATEYKGRIARNAAYIIEYLLALAYSPKTRVDEIPVKLWGHYLPETLEFAVNRLYGIEAAGLMFHHYLPDWTDQRCTGAVKKITAPRTSSANATADGSPAVGAYLVRRRPTGQPAD